MECYPNCCDYDSICRPDFGIPAARVKGLYLAIATLAAQFIMEDFFSRAAWFTGGVDGASSRTTKNL